MDRNKVLKDLLTRLQSEAVQASERGDKTARDRALERQRKVVAAEQARRIAGMRVVKHEL